MKTTLINGSAISQEILGTVADRVHMLDRKPGLAIILVGTNPESTLYVKLKQQAANKVGIQTHLYSFPDNAPTEEIIAAIRFLNDDDEVDGIIVQLPLPDGQDAEKILNAVDPDKDADGFLERNRTLLLTDAPYVLPVLARVIETILDRTNLDLNDKRAAIISDNDVFATPIAHLLRARGAATDIVQPAAEQKGVRDADLIISASGLPLSITKEHIKEGAAIIDIGITKKGNQVYGDVDPLVDGTALWRTPVPGGVGPMTVALLLDNVVELNKKHS